MTQSNKLEEVVVMEYPIHNKVAQILLEAMNYSSVKKLMIRDVSKDVVSKCSYPTDKVEMYY